MRLATMSKRWHAGSLAVVVLALVPTAPLWAQEAKLKATLQAADTQVVAVAFSPDGKTLASGVDSQRKPGDIKLWDVATGKVQTSLPVGTNSVFSLGFSPDGNTLASGL